MPTLSVAVAVIAMGEVVWVEPSAGEVMETVGGVVSLGAPPTGVAESLATSEAFRAMLYIRTSSMTPEVKSEAPPN